MPSEIAEGAWSVYLWVPGKAEPQGSKTRGRFSIYDDNPKTAPWKERVALAASKWMHDKGLSPLPPKTPVHVTMDFILPRLASAPKTRVHPPAVSKPDIDKLVRSVFDALTGTVFHDDSNVISLTARKRRAEIEEEPGVMVALGKLSQSAQEHWL